jgi:phosphatidylglycerophosphate synthase
LISFYIVSLLLIYPFPQVKNQIFFWFIIGSLLDFFDGLIARSKNSCSSWGAFLDRLADKTLVVPLMAYFLWPISHWVVIALIGLEISSVIVALIGIGIKTNISSNWIGKYKMVLQIIIVLMIFFIPLDIWQRYNLVILVWITIATAIASFVGHLQNLYLKKNT